MNSMDAPPVRTTRGIGHWRRAHTDLKLTKKNDKRQRSNRVKNTSVQSKMGKQHKKTVNGDGTRETERKRHKPNVNSEHS